MNGCDLHGVSTPKFSNDYMENIYRNMKDFVRPLTKTEFFFLGLGFLSF